MRTPYKMADEAAVKITSKLRREFRHNRLAMFDEMNVVQTKKHVNKLYKNVLDIVFSEFLKVIGSIIEDVYAEALDMGFDGDIRDLDESWIEEFFEEYNPVTKYVFANEFERKKMRLFESLVADVPGRMQSYKAAEKLLINQIKQYSIELEDAVTKVVYKDLKVNFVMWNSEDDDKTCGVCNELDGQVFELADAPPKQHYHCRCYLTPVKK